MVCIAGGTGRKTAQNPIRKGQFTVASAGAQRTDRGAIRQDFRFGKNAPGKKNSPVGRRGQVTTGESTQFC